MNEDSVDKFSKINTDLIECKLNNLNMQTNQDKRTTSGSYLTSGSCSNSSNISYDEQIDQLKSDKMVQTSDANQANHSIKHTTNDNKNEKRKDYLVWEDYFMSVALLSAKRSKDPSTQVGACIVNNDNKIVSIGYNGMPINCNDDLLPWGKNSENELENKYL